MAVNPIVTAGKDLIIPVDGRTLSGALAAGTSPGAYCMAGGVGVFASATATSRGGSRYDLGVTAANLPTENGVLVFKATGIVHQQYQIFPEGPIKGAAQRIWFIKVKSSDGTHDLTSTAPTCEWFVAGSGTAATLTPAPGAQPEYWYVDLSSGQTDVDSGLLRITGTGLIPLSIPIFFSTAASGGGGGTGEEENMEPDAIYVRLASASWATDASVVAGDKVRLSPSRPDAMFEYWVVGNTTRNGNGVPVPPEGRIVTVPTGGALQYRCLDGARELVVEVQNA